MENGSWRAQTGEHRGKSPFAYSLLTAHLMQKRRLRVIASHPEYHLWQGRFSPDSRWISFNAFKRTDGATSTIYVVTPSGGPWIRITEGQYWDDKPRWSPDGKTIYFVSNRTGFLNVWKVRFEPTSGQTLGPARARHRL